jgi:cell division protein FtsN
MQEIRNPNGAVMNYDFSLNKKSLIFIISGCLAVSVLVFFAGFVLGWDRGTKHPAQLELKKQNAPVAVQNQPAAASTSIANQPTATPVPAANTKPAPSSGVASAATASREPSTPNSETSVDPRQMPEESSMVGGKSAANTEPTVASEQAAFSLQVGAYQNESNAQRCRKAIQARGYAAFLFDTRDAEGHTWHAVRIGRYADVKKASTAAVAFTVKEKIPVFIRPANEL